MRPGVRRPDNPEQVDIATLDVEDLLIRFQNLRKQNFKPQVLEAYKRRFRNAVKSYKQYLDNPGTWRPASQERSGASERRRRSSNPSPESSVEISRSARSHAASADGMSEEYRLPLRPSVMARLVLPLDLTREEATRIKVFVDMLVVPTSAKSDQ